MRLFSFLGSWLVLGLTLVATRDRVIERAPGPAVPNEDGIQVSREFTVEELVQDIFVKGGCKNISNIRAIGHPDGIGFFQNGNNVIGLEKGIIISTGNIDNARGPNNSTEASSDFNDGSGDRDLNLLATDRVYDAVGLEFDFVPLDSIVTFRYVFASEEYCEYVGSEFNDVFGFFISGPGINGNFSRNAENVALVPGSNDFVSINNINHLQNSAYYVSNELPADAQTCGKTYVPSPFQDLIQYDGFTEGLTAVLRLEPCQTYRLRLVVSDVSDELFDSAVFLEAESFNIGGEVTISTEATIDSTIVVEGCSDGYFVFERYNKEDLSKDLEVDIKIGRGTTATPGVDFEPLPARVVIPSGELTYKLPVTVINDQLRENREVLVLELDFPCDCVTGKASMIFSDPPELSVLVSNQEICPDEEARLSPEVSGGTPDYSYAWNTGETTAEIRVSPEQTTTYSVTVTDHCGQVQERNIRVVVTDPAEAVISGFADICPGESGTLEVNFTGVPPWEFTYAIDGQEAPPLRGIVENPYYLRTGQEGLYTLVDFRDSRCAGLPRGAGEIVITRLKIQAEPKSASCWNTADGRVDVAVTGGDFPYRYEWDQGQGNQKNLVNVAPGPYQLSVTDAKGCSATKSVAVGSPPPIQEATFECLDLGTDSLSFFTTGGSPPYSFSVDGLNFFDASLFNSLTEGQRYILTIRDSRNCRLEQDFIMPINTDNLFDLPREIFLILGDRYVLSPQLNIPESLVGSFFWTPATDLSCVDCREPILTAQKNSIYRMRFTDRFGCWEEESIIVNVNREPRVFIPTAFSPNSDGHNDQFMVFADQTQISMVKTFQVFNRWGNLLFEVRDVPPNQPDYGWDGRFRGIRMDPGIYIYFVEVALVNGTVLNFTGDVLLVN